MAILNGSVFQYYFAMERRTGDTAVQKVPHVLVKTSGPQQYRNCII